jgi:hypothetical protein
LKLLLDEHHSPRAATRLRELGHDVVSAAAEAHLTTLSDDPLLRAATAANRALVTEDSDFLSITRWWSQTGQEHAGIVITPARRFRNRRGAYPGNLVRALDVFLTNNHDEPRNAVWWLPGA